MRRMWWIMPLLLVVLGCGNEAGEAVETDQGCTPDCAGRECGDDGCGGSCGVCNDGAFCTSEECTEGLCEATVTEGCFIDDTCVPPGQDHPDDPCAACTPELSDSLWSALPDGTKCGGGGACFEGVCCDPDQACAGKDCGDDGCGGTCGECTDGDACVDGVCTVADCLACLPWQICDDDLDICVDPEPTGGDCPAAGDMLGTDCKDVAGVGCCDGSTLYYCGADNGCPNGEATCLCTVECGSGADGLSCGWMVDADAPHGGLYMCVKAATAAGEPTGLFPWQCKDVCHPDCDGKQCGDDGCDGSCGDCHPDIEECVEGTCACLFSECGAGCCLEGETCFEDSCCAPVCDGKECGDDGCGGTCGDCSDDDACNGVEVCEEGACLPGEAPTCDDENPCTDDSCDSETGCVNAPNTEPCDDGDVCTVEDTCADGACVGGAALVCDDENPCTDDSCDPETGCANVANTEPCSDGDACNGEEACADGVCQAGESPVCDDENPCTDDSCDPEAGCINAPNTEPCDDGDACTTVDTCTDGACVGGAAPLCADENPCTDDSCDSESGCVNAPNTEPCDDGDACTTADTCADSACVGGAAPVCADENPCTDDSCDSELGCVNAPNTGPCDDGDACTTADTCAEGACVGGAAPICVDENPCTDDSCVPDTGCLYTPNTAPCDDLDACTTQDTCADGVCVGGAAPVCTDENPCTDDSCESETGCVNTFNTSPCDDLDACTTGDTCSGGACIGGGATDCGDSDACTVDTCEGLVGCIHTPLECDDDNLCTNDTCNSETGCVFMQQLCDDENPCTADSCDEGTGECVFNDALKNGTSCDDDNPCTTADACLAGVCAGVQLLGCCLEDVDCQPNEICVDNGCVCVPACGGKACGPDGCGGFCGECSVGFACEDGLCIGVTCDKAWEVPDCLGDCAPQAWIGNGACDDGSTGAYFACAGYGWDAGDCDPCEPNCTGMECGLDPICNYPCGSCDESDYCLDGVCMECSCELAECGTGPCGEDCGLCPEGTGCVDNICEPMTCEGACGDMAPMGCWCDDLCFGYGDCCEDICDFCEAEHPDECSCVPDCEGKECGSDGCWGNCGLCEGTCVEGMCFDDLGCVVEETPGCNGCGCEDCVCAIDPWCCETEWDEQCVQECLSQCGGCGSMLACGDGVCTPDGGENCMACPEDCGCPDSLTCTWINEESGFQCFPDLCGSGVVETRCCDGNVLLNCDIGVGADTLIEDCSLGGYICGWFVGDATFPPNYYCGTEDIIIPEDPSGTYPAECPFSSCIPQCAGKACGDDGCGGVCGECGTTKECIDNQCVQVTCPPQELPDCVGECFPENWVGDGLCDDGTWGAYFNCDYYAWDDGDCEPPCVPDCEGLTCGADPVCGESCGTCDESAICLDGICAPLDGESCETALPLNGGIPIGASDLPWSTSEQGDTTGHISDLTGSCDDDTTEAFDLVYRLELSTAALADISMDFDGTYNWPAVYIFTGSCVAPNEAGCQEATSGAATIDGLTLAPGTYYIVADASYPTDKGPYTLNIDLSPLPECDFQPYSTGFDTGLDGWIEFGSPLPVVESNKGNPAPSFDNNGDSGYNSGAISESTFDFSGGVIMSAGVLVESVPAGCWTGATFGVAAGGLDDYGSTADAGTLAGVHYEYNGDACWGSPDDEKQHGKLSCWVRKPDGTTETYYSAINDDALDEWHHFSITVTAEGHASCNLDGVLLGTSVATADMATLLDRRIYLGSRSGTYGQALIDNLTVECVPTEDCTDGIDNDLDGLADCADSDCIELPECLGEICEVPIVLNAGMPVTEGDLPWSHSEQGDTTGRLPDLTGSCDADTAAASDLVYRLDLSTLAVADISLDFTGVNYPAVYVFQGECEPGNEFACAKANTDAAVITDLELEPGTYFVVADASYPGDAGPFTLTIELSAPCSPQCVGKQCGDDGCGGSCGACSGQEVCEGDVCMCQPDCAGKECGDDGCGGSCGACSGQDVCVGNLCVCQPDCVDKDCGDDGCGGLCGACSGQEVCVGDLCVCQPDCIGKECGDDGCGGLCGICDCDETCTGGTCITPCLSHAGKKCVDGDPYWFDSCGAQEEKASECGSSTCYRYHCGNISTTCSPDSGFQTCAYGSWGSASAKLQTDSTTLNTFAFVNGQWVVVGPYRYRVRCTAQLYKNSTSCSSGGCNGQYVGTNGTFEITAASPGSSTVPEQNFTCFENNGGWWGWQHTVWYAWTVPVVECAYDSHCGDMHNCVTQGPLSGWTCEPCD